MNQDLRRRFAELHKPGEPVLLYNIWDVASAKAVAEAGAPALATGSYAISEANGYRDGEEIPFNLYLDCTRRIVEGVDLPVTADFESGFAVDPARIADHAKYLAETGAVGCNFEDGEVGAARLHPVAQQAKRVAAVVASGLWVNARTDLFLQRLVAGENPNDRALMPEALERAHAFAEAGAHSFFVPGLGDYELIAEVCEGSPLPVNVIKGDALEIPALAETGVARISWGPRPWRWAMQRLTEEARALYR